ncbi:hypothetical protein HYQ46_000323 [Verticillium longisporum]|nr:hypothetical protein HYQ46_000323 [Verticillium longisporum]
MLPPRAEVRRRQRRRHNDAGLVVGVRRLPGHGDLHVGALGHVLVVGERGRLRRDDERRALGQVVFGLLSLLLLLLLLLLLRHELGRLVDVALDGPRRRAPPRLLLREGVPRRARLGGDAGEDGP